MDYKIADRLIELRKKSGLSQDELADKLSISRQAISKWERGESLPDTENLIALSKLYSVTLDELVANEKVNEGSIAIIEKRTAANSASKFITKKATFLIIALAGFIVMAVCLALTGYFIAELIEIHQPGFVFEPGDTLQSERVGYIISLAFSAIFTFAGLVVGIIFTIKYRRQKIANKTRDTSI
ncbi:MAG: helix-turn-helix domain-containing protein [Firmicutes bacterium]|nr:helix-turn-helix domain-containing protein [Bacillota bacterium]